MIDNGSVLEKELREILNLKDARNMHKGERWIRRCRKCEPVSDYVTRDSSF